VSAGTHGRLRWIAVGVTATVVLLGAIGLYSADRAPGLPVSSNSIGLVSYQFISPEVGWLDLYYGETVIAKTTDGGLTWHRQLLLAAESPVTSVATMQFFNAQDGVVIGEQELVSQGEFLPAGVPTIWRTRDGGVHWQKSQLVMDPTDVRTVGPGLWVVVSGSFLDSQRGWLLLTGWSDCAGCVPDNSALVYQTSDGGAHWNKLARLQYRVGQWRAIKFVTASAGFVLTSGAGPYVTHDGGATWTIVDLPMPIPADPPLGIVSKEAPRFFSGSSAVMAVTLGYLIDMPCPAWSPGTPLAPSCHYPVYKPSARYIYSSADGGLSWTRGQQLPTSGQLLFIDPRNWINITSKGVTETADAGATWSSAHEMPIRSGWYLSDAQFPDPRNGWVTLSDDPNGAELASYGETILNSAMSPRFAMLSTSDGGVSWHQVLLPNG
jgi:photosystem II stability/assembly factor-like uncharacterized protein